MTEEDKKNYIRQDFHKRVVVPCGAIPDTSYAEADEWWDKQIPIWNAWAKRYKGNTYEKFAYHIWNEYMKPIESIYVRLLKERMKK